MNVLLSYTVVASSKRPYFMLFLLLHQTHQWITLPLRFSLVILVFNGYAGYPQLSSITRIHYTLKVSPSCSPNKDHHPFSFLAYCQSSNRPQRYLRSNRPSMVKRSTLIDNSLFTWLQPQTLLSFLPLIAFCQSMNIPQR